MIRPEVSKQTSQWTFTQLHPKIRLCKINGFRLNTRLKIEYNWYSAQIDKIRLEVLIRISLLIGKFWITLSNSWHFTLHAFQCRKYRTFALSSSHHYSTSHILYVTLHKHVYKPDQLNFSLIRMIYFILANSQSRATEEITSPPDSVMFTQYDGISMCRQSTFIYVGDMRIHEEAHVFQWLLTGWGYAHGKLCITRIKPCIFSSLECAPNLFWTGILLWIIWSELKCNDFVFAFICIMAVQDRFILIIYKEMGKRHITRRKRQSEFAFRP